MWQAAALNTACAQAVSYGLARLAGTRKHLSRCLKPELLIIDDIGIKRLPPQAGEYLFEIITRRA